jgi:RNA polymerase sigma factor (sigma-70 family)
MGIAAVLEDSELKRWFFDDVLPHEKSLTSFIRRNCRHEDDILDLRQDVYQQILTAARAVRPQHPKAYLFAIARNLLINRAKREKIVSFEYVADLEALTIDLDVSRSERGLEARDELRRAIAGLDCLPARCREVVRLRKVEGYSTRQVADELGIGIDTVEKQMTLGMRALVDFMLGGSGKIRRQSPSGSVHRKLET